MKTDDLLQDERDTLVVPIQKDGFAKVFLGEKSWYPLRISKKMIGKLKFIAAYQIRPISAITHYAIIDRIESCEIRKQFKCVFSKIIDLSKPVPLGNAPRGAMQVPRYTSFTRLQVAQSVNDLF